MGLYWNADFPIGNPIGFSWLDLIELELVGICFYQLEISPPNIFPNEYCFSSQQGPIGKTIFILFQGHQLDLVKNCSNWKIEFKMLVREGGKD